MIECLVGVMAYNEEANIARLLEALLSQKTDTVHLSEVIVVASGCTDRTEEIVTGFARGDQRVKLLHQAKREGKASAINLFLRHADAPVIVLVGADTLPAPGAIEALVSPLHDPEIGMVGGHPVPNNPANSLLGFGVHLMWDLHHQISLRYPKMGEMVAFRSVIQQIPCKTAVDEASIEPLILRQGLKLHYAPGALVYNHGPETLSDFIAQRRRIYIGHLYVKDTQGYKVSTMSAARVAQVFLNSLRPNGRYLVWGLLIAFLEVYARWMAIIDYNVLKRNPYIWPVAKSTKKDLTQVP